MGSFSIFHWLIGGQFLLFVVLVGAVIYLLVRKSSKPAGLDPAVSRENLLPESSSSPVAVQSSPATFTREKAIALLYMVGGVLGLLNILGQLDGRALDPISAISWLILIAQLAAALYGGWQFWQNKPLGAQILYWISWSCVPVVSIPGLNYWVGIGLAWFPSVSISLGSFSTDFTFRFGYAARLWFTTDSYGITIGANVIALALALALARYLAQSGVAKWPLALPASMSKS
jgi:hypothetical protein